MIPSISSQWQRTREKIGVLVWFLGMASALPFTIFTVYIIFYTEYWLIGLAYVTWIYYDHETPRNGGRKWSCRWRLPIPRWYSEYFPLKLVKTTDLDPSRNYLFACHPHGIAIAGMCGNLAEDGSGAHLAFPGFTRNSITLDFIFFIPIYRELLLALGACTSSANSISALLKRAEGGNIVLILPGGARESLYSHSGTEEIILRNRKGFVRLAIQNGAPIVPVYSFGENELYSQIPNPNGSWIRTLQEKCANLIGFPLVQFIGTGIFQSYIGFLPRRHPVTTVVGSPIEVKQMDHPTQAYVDHVHAVYIEVLRSLYITHRAKYGNPKSELIIH